VPAGLLARAVDLAGSAVLRQAQDGWAAGPRPALLTQAPWWRARTPAGTGPSSSCPRASWPAPLTLPGAPPFDKLRTAGLRGRAPRCWPRLPGGGRGRPPALDLALRARGPPGPRRWPCRERRPSTSSGRLGCGAVLPCPRLRSRRSALGDQAGCASERELRPDEPSLPPPAPVRAGPARPYASQPAPCTGSSLLLALGALPCYTEVGEPPLLPPSVPPAVCQHP